MFVDASCDCGYNSFVMCACNYGSSWLRLRSPGCSLWAVGWLWGTLAWKRSVPAPKGGVTLQKAGLQEVAHGDRTGCQIRIIVSGRKDQSCQRKWSWLRQPKKAPPRRPKWASFSPVLGCGCVGGVASLDYLCIRMNMNISQAHTFMIQFKIRVMFMMIHIWM